jgi:2-polyprenyl-3-methyl-5-hydroxy-6-metoxy-1,4-benzoquinol methylase
MIKKFLKKIKNHKWEKAQKKEKESWIDLWADKEKAQKLGNDEIKKQTFILNNLEENFDIKFETDLTNKNVLDVGCGPVSFFSRIKKVDEKAGVDPLIYPDWVYEQYKNNNFKVFKVPFENFSSNIKYDVIVFYNALQHFKDLGEVVKKCSELIKEDGFVYLSEYLNIPKDGAHINYLTKNKLDNIFSKNGFVLNSITKEVRLDGYVEMGNGKPIKLYMAKMKLKI